MLNGKKNSEMTEGMPEKEQKVRQEIRIVQPDARKKVRRMHGKCGKRHGSGKQIRLRIGGEGVIFQPARTQP